MYAVVERCSLPRVLPDDEVLIVSAAIPGNCPPMDSLAALLSSDELTRSSRFRYTKDRDTFILGRALLRTCLAYYLGVPAQDVTFSYSSEGKPQVDRGVHPDPIEFNLSHTEGLVVVAISRAHRIGIDVESDREVPDAVELADRFFTATEAAHLRSLSAQERNLAFLNSWTRKEAFAKATGRGLSSILEESRPEEVEEGMKAFSWHPFPLDEQFVGVVAVEGPAGVIQHVRFSSLEQLVQPLRKTRAAVAR